MDKQLYTARDVAQALGHKGTSHVYALIRAGELPAVKVGSKQGGVRIPRQAFEEYLLRLNEAARASVAVPSGRSLKEICKGLPPEIPAPDSESFTEMLKRIAPTMQLQPCFDKATEGFAMYLRNSAPRR